MRPRFVTRLALIPLSLALAPAALAQNPFHLTDGNPVVWGNTTSGQGTLPTLPANTFVRQISPGLNHVVALLTDGTLVGWGSNGAGQLNIPALPNGTRYTFVSSGSNHTLAVRSDGVLLGWGDPSNGVTTAPALPAGVTYRTVDAGGSHAVATRSDGTAVAWGLNASGQTNVPALPAGVTYVAVGATNAVASTLALRSDSVIVGWGAGFFGINAPPTAPAGTFFTGLAAGDKHALALRSDGAVVGWGGQSPPPTTIPSLPAGVVYTAISAGFDYSLCLRSNGTIASFGTSNFAVNVPPAPPAGSFYTAVNAFPSSYTATALLGISTFPGDLRLFGSGLSAPTATLNRNLTVTGDLLAETFSAIQNAPLIEVEGSLRLSGSSTLSGQGQINVAGDLVTPAAGTQALLQNTTVVIEGRVIGAGGLALDGAAVTFNTHNTIAFSSYLYAYGASVLDFTGTSRFGSKGLLINSPANLRLSAGQSYVNSSTGYNAGQLDVLGSAAFPASFESKGAFQNYDPGVVNATHATLRFPAGLTNYSDLRFTSGHSDVFGAVNNMSDAALGTGSILVTGGASATFYNNLVNNGSITVSKQGATTSVLTVLGTLSGAGPILGQGDTFIEGTFSPGNSPAAVTVEGDLHLTPSSTLLIELGGTTLGTGYDHLDVGGTLAFSGNLTVVVLPGYNVFSALEYDLLDFAGRSGQFSTLTLPPLPGKWIWDTSFLYTDGTIRITSNIIPEPATASLLLPAAALLRRRRR